MKKLSIVQKAIAYDEAIQRANELNYVSDKDSLQRKTVEHIFPQLKESEKDDRIRNYILSHLQQHLKTVREFTSKGFSSPFSAEEIKMLEASVAWLEKPTDTDNEFTRMRETKPKDISEFLVRLTTAEQEFLWEHIAKIRELDKKEQKDILENAILDSNEDGLIAETIKYKNEQKLVDKVEPKFKVGDWVVRGKTIAQILDIQEQYYIGLDINGNDFTSSRFLSDDKIHLWDITKDAKDGDVLMTDMVIFIFKENKEGSVFMYCNYSVVSNSFSISNTAEVNEIYVHPATKEQRDTLLKAMADAGYTFDFEKKELKKIEQKHTPKHKVGDTIYYNSFGELKSMIVANVITSSTDNPMYEDENGDAVFEKDLVEPKFKVGDTVKDPYGGLYHITEIIDDSYKTDDGRFILLKNQEVYTLSNFTAWSEEDKIHYNKCLSYLESISPRKEDIEWFKSLKDRVQPKQECH